jgi:DNA-binding NarL/FixJ family response regulator
MVPGRDGWITVCVDPVTLLLAVPDPFVREVLLRAVRRRPELVLVEAVADGLAAVEAVRRHVPDVAVLDIALPHLSGVDASREILGSRPQVHTRVLLLDDEQSTPRARAIASGAAGLLPRTASSVALCSAIVSIANGGTIFQT